MSEAPRLELNPDLDFDLSASTTSQLQHTQAGTPQPMQSGLDAAPSTSSSQNLQASAINTKNSIMESESDLHLSHPHPLTLLPHTSHLTPHTSHLTPHTSHLAPRTSYAHSFFHPNPHPAASHAMSATTNHPAVQNAKETVLNGPIAQSVQAEGAKTRDEFADLANARQIPEHKAATGQNLTHYHSMFYRLLSWKNPRATSIAFATTVLFIFAARYLNLIRYLFKGSYMLLGATATGEVVGQLAFGRGLTTQFRPRRYFTIPKASLQRMTDDVEQLINFFVIESQRVVFAENVYITIAAFFASFFSYFLIKFVPLWGLSLIATTVAFLGPLIYTQNKEVIDAQIEKGYHIANQQAKQVKDLAAQHTENAVRTVQGYTQQATAKAQETVNQYRGTSPTPKVAVKKEDFPAAPTNDFAAETAKEETASSEPLAEPVL